MAQLIHKKCGAVLWLPPDDEIAGMASEAWAIATANKAIVDDLMLKCNQPNQLSQCSFRNQLFAALSEQNKQVFDEHHRWLNARKYDDNGRLKCCGDLQLQATAVSFCLSLRGARLLRQKESLSLRVEREGAVAWKRYVRATAPHAK